MTFEFKPIEAGKLDATQKVGDILLTLRVENLRRNKDNIVVGTLKFGVNSTVVFSDEGVQLGKDDHRHQFANRLYGTRQTKGMLSDAALVSAYPITQFEQDMMLWAEALWEQWLGTSSGEWVAGDADPSAPRWAVPGFILEESPGIHFGNAKAGKSTLDRLLAVSLQYDINTLFPVRQWGNVMWVNGEESPQEVTRQWGNVNAVLGLKRDTPMYTLDARGINITDLSPRIKKAVEREKVAHIFVDSLSRLAQGMSLNDNSTATGIIDSIAGLGASVTWIGHTGQSNTHRLAGSKHFTNAARLMVRVQGRSSPGEAGYLRRGVRCEVTDANGAAPQRPSYLTLDYHEEYGVQDASKANEYDWPALQCQYTSDNGNQCRRMTWDGLDSDGLPKCPKHIYDGGQES